MNKNLQHKGQVALVLVLIMTVVGALAVSLASRSTIDTRIQQTESQNVQALLLAQTGLEQMIINPTTALVGSVEDDTYEAVSQDFGMASFDTGRVSTGNTVEINLVGADFTSSSKLSGFSVYWKADIANSGSPSLLISLISNTGVIADYAYAATADNGFIGASGGVEGFDYSTPKIALTSSIAKLRITVLGSAAIMRVVPLDIGASFPSQVRTIKSIGSVKSDANLVKYGLQYDESTANNIPTIFDYALFSGGSIIQ